MIYNKWISVKDNLPEEGEIAECYNTSTKAFYGLMYYDNGWYDENGVENAEYDKPPTHWLIREPLPQPPKP